MESSSTIAIGVLSAVMAALLGYSYMQRSKITELKDYRTEACKQLYASNRLFNPSQVDKLLDNPRDLDVDEVRMIRDCKKVIFPSKWFGGKTRRVRKDTFTSRRR